jgi:mannosyltransferase OCH1-like enzyme
MENIFTNIYEKKIWGNNNNGNYNGSSGPGSDVDFNKETYIPFLQSFIINHNIKTVTDLGCGDFRCGPFIYDTLDVSYTGYDAYKKIVEYNASQYSLPKYNFIHLDFCNHVEKINNSDLYILKDVIQHWRLEDINRFLDYIIENKKCKYILITNCCYQTEDNQNVENGGFRHLSCDFFPLKKYNPKKLYNYSSKEVSVIEIVDKHKNIFQTHKSLEYIQSKPKVQHACNTWRQYHGKNDYVYHFYDDELCDKFMKENFDERTYEAYCMLPLIVMKTDLWRYCVVYKCGGIYADTDTVLKVYPDFLMNDKALLTLAPENGYTFLCQWFFSAPPHSPILKSVIDLSVERIHSIEKPICGEHVIHYLTGPAVFTDGIEQFLKQNNYPTFSKKGQYQDYPYPDILHVFNSEIFHRDILVHLFTGGDEDGWYKERYEKLC